MPETARAGCEGWAGSRGQAEEPGQSPHSQAQLSQHRVCVASVWIKGAYRVPSWASFPWPPPALLSPYLPAGSAPGLPVTSLPPSTLSVAFPASVAPGLIPKSTCHQSLQQSMPDLGARAGQGRRSEVETTVLGLEQCQLIWGQQCRLLWLTWGRRQVVPGTLGLRRGVCQLRVWPQNLALAGAKDTPTVDEKLHGSVASAACLLGNQGQG